MGQSGVRGVGGGRKGIGGMVEGREGTDGIIEGGRFGYRLWRVCGDLNVMKHSGRGRWGRDEGF